MDKFDFAKWQEWSKQPPIFIAVIGMTGVGKSTFIRNLTEDDDVKIGTGLNSCTKDVKTAKMVHRAADGQSYDVCLVDTPGFDDTELSDSDILSTLANWLSLQHERALKLSGLIYLHRITDDRMTGSAVRNLIMMRNLCGEENMQNVVLVTTRWETVHDHHVAEENEHGGLLAPGGFWHGMIQQGATYTRYNGTTEAAAAIIDRLIHQAPIYLAIQQELSQGKSINETAAALELQLAEEEMRREAERVAEQAARSAELLAEEGRRQAELLAAAQREAEAMQRIQEEERQKLQESIAAMEAQVSQRRRSRSPDCVVM
ncbi:P-loop containing nucleoside triphosphate hydrolase protein [Terfezia claveryi]|nr:P-loop containing nucleoside triphosphate hydrolase protein [Terfezia claveryi]